LLEALVSDYIVKNRKLYIEYADRNGNYKQILAPLKPYFFAQKRSVEAVRRFVEKYGGFVDDSDGKYVALYTNEELIKVIVPYPFLVKPLRFDLERSGILTFESDIPFRQRWRIDCDVNLPENFKVAYWDIEVDSRKGLPDPKVAEQRIISITLIDNDYNEYFFCDDDERKIIYEFLKTINNKYPVLLAWNSDRFDYPYLVSRCKKLGLDYKFSRHDWVDLMVLSKVAMPAYRGSRRLDDMGLEFLGIGKTETFETKEGIERLYRLFKEDRERLKRYNVRDVLLMVELDNELSITKRCVEIARTIGSMLLSDVASQVRMAEIAFLRKELNSNPRIVFPKKPHGQHKEGSRFKGALILSPFAGFHKNLYELDYKSMYNRIMQSWFISYENIAEEDDDDAVLTPVLKFKKNPNAKVPSILKTLEKVRNRYKREMLKYSPGSIEYAKLKVKQDAVKTAILSIYGVFGNAYFRGDNVELAESVTLCGQESIKAAMKVAESLGYRTVYAHTDGLFIKPREKMSLRKMINEFPNLVEDLNYYIKEYLITKFNLEPKYYNMQLEPRRVVEKVYFSSANCYYLRGVWYEGSVDLHYDVKGLQMKHTDMCELLKFVQKNILDILIDADDVNNASVEVKKYLRQVYKDLFAGKYDEQLVFKRGVQRPLDTYKANQPHLRAAKKLSEKALFRPGDKIRFVIVSDGNNNGGVQEVEPVIDAIPKIQKSGYMYYWGRISELAKKILGFEIRPENLTLLEVLSNLNDK